MGYRTIDKPPKPEDMLIRFPVRNGATLRVGFDVFFVGDGPTHDPHFHDFINWPAPNYHAGLPCQMRQPRDNPRPYDGPPWHRAWHEHNPKAFDEIDLRKSGYRKGVVTFEDVPEAEYLTPRCTIDPDDVNKVNLSIDANLPEFKDKPKDIRFTVYLTSGGSVYDELLHGIVTVLPAKSPR